LRTLSNKQKATVAAVTLLTLGGAGGLAYAYWTQSGSGVGTAATDTTASVTVNQTSTVTALYPGQAAQALSGNFDNPNPGPVFVTAITATVRPFTAQANLAKPACTEADYAISGASRINTVPAGSEVPAGTGVGAWDGLAVKLVDGAANQDNCKGVTISIDYSAS